MRQSNESVAADTADVAAAARVAAVAHSTDSGCPAVVAHSADSRRTAAVDHRRPCCRMIEDSLQRQAGQEQRSGPFSAGHSAIALNAVATAAMIDAALAAVAAAATGLAVGIVVAETSTDQALHKLVQTPRSPHDFGQESQTYQDHAWGPSAGAYSVDCHSNAESADEPCLAASTDVVDPDV